MPSLAHIVSLFLIAFFLGGQVGYGQGLFGKKEPLNIEEQKVYEVFNFPNIDELDYYFDKKERKKIEELRAAKDVEGLKKALTRYVNQFGPANFRRDQAMLWELAQIYENKGNDPFAVYLYSILLKHTDAGVEEIRDFYALYQGRDPKERFVPIRYYYKLVDYRKNIDTLRPPRGVFTNMGFNINSKYADYGPFLNPEMDLLLFTSTRNRVQTFEGEVANENLFYSVKDQYGWNPAKPLKNINTRYNEGSAALHPNGKRLYFTRCKSPDGVGSCDIFVAHRQDSGEWKNIRPLGEPINSQSWDSHPMLSHGGDTLYFASDRLGGFGGIDLYYSVRTEEDKWGPAHNMGPVINTAGNEMSPFYHPVFDVLYFSSERQIMNFGRYDIYKAYPQGDGWQEPINIGPLVNGEGNEYYFTIDSRSEDLFYARSPDGKTENLDLYSFPLPMKAQPQATTKFKGRLTDKETGEGFSGIVSVIDVEKGVEVAPKFLKEDGSFQFNLINNRKYMLVIQGDDFFRFEKMIDLEGDSAVNLQTQSLNFLRLQFESIEFDVGSAKIKRHMTKDLDKLTGYLLEHPEMELKVSGHTDDVGSEDFNQQLSQARADSIKQYIVERGDIDPERIEAKGYGSSKPLIENPQTEEERKLNRRVEFEIITNQEGGIPTSREELFEKGALDSSSFSRPTKPKPKPK